MIKKMYFPREIIVFAGVTTNFVVMVIGYLTVLIALAVTGNAPQIQCLLILLPALVVTYFFAMGASLLLSSITVYIRDLQHLLTSVSMVFYFLTPMYFNVDGLSEEVKNIIWLNPLTYFVELFHKLVYYNEVPMSLFFICLILSAISLMIGLLTFNKLKNGFAERI